MVNIHIHNRPTPDFTLFGKTFNLNLHESVKNKIKHKDHPVTQEVLKALKSIERNSKVKSFVTKPLVILITGIAAVAIGTILTAIASIFSAAMVGLGLMIGGLTLGLSGTVLTMMGRFEMDSFSRVSRAYNDQAVEARQLIDEIERNQKLGNLINIRL